MRIGIDIRCLAEGKRTGVEEYTLSLLDKLFRLDEKNEYVLFFNAWKKVSVDFSWLEKYPHVTLKRFRIPNKLLNLSLWYLHYPHLDRLIGGTDVFFVPNLTFLGVSKKTKLVVTAHDLSFELFPETFSWYRRFWHFLIDFRGLLKRSHRVIAVSHSTRSDLVGWYGIRQEKISVIPSGVGEQFTIMSRNDPRLLSVKEKYGLPYRFILSLGTLEPRKNMLALLRAFEGLSLTFPKAKDYMLVIAGSPGWKAKPFLEALESSPVRARVKLVGFIDDDDKPALYNLATLFVYPSFYEGFGFPPLEALSCGTPVIASHASSLPEVVGKAGLLVDPYRPDELRQAITFLLSDEKVQVAIKNEILLQRGRFSWEKTAHATLALFQSLG